MTLDREQSANIPALPAKGTTVPTPPANYSEVFRGYRALAELADLHGSPSASEHPTRHPLSPAGIEMLEAELQNQGVLPNTAGDILPLSYRIGHQVSFMRWKARSHGLYSPNTLFAVDLPNYLIQVGAGLLSHDSKSEVTSMPLRLSCHDLRFNIVELHYLNSLAAFLVRPQESRSNKFSKGLDLVIYSILRSELVDANDPNVVVLPVTIFEYLASLRQPSSTEF